MNILKFLPISSASVNISAGEVLKNGDGIAMHHADNYLFNNVQAYRAKPACKDNQMLASSPVQSL